MATDIYLPAGKGPFPTILTRLPYDKCSLPAMVPWVAAHMADRGYAFVAQDVRGKFRSEGERMAFVSEARDGYDTLEWIAGQPWSERIGMWGESYCGYTQWAAVASGHPALSAIVPRLTSTEIVGDWLHRQGVFELSFAAWWAVFAWADESIYSVPPWDLDWSVRPLRDLLAASFELESPSFDAWQRVDGRSTDFDRAVFGGARPSTAIQVPALHLGGWYDYFRRGQVADWGRASLNSSAPQYLVMDSIDHGLSSWELEPPGLRDYTDWGTVEEIEALIPEYLDDTMRFYDRVLRGVDAPEPAIVSYRVTRGEWRESEGWPPPGATSVILHLADLGAAGRGETGSLSRGPDRSSGWARWVHDPSDLVPSTLVDPMQALAAETDDRAVRDRADVLSFASDPLAEPMTLAGSVTADLGVGSSAPSMHVIVKLLDAFGDGRTRRICEGAALVSDATDDRRVRVGLGPIAYRVEAEHRLELQIASSDFPIHLPYPGTEEDPWIATGAEPNEQRIAVGGPGGSKLYLTTASSG